MKDNSDESDGSDSDSDSDKSSKDSDSESGSESEEEKSSGGLPKFLPKLSHTSYSYSNKNRTCTWSGSSWQGTAVATKTSKYAVKLGSNCGYLMLGFANPKNLNKFSSNYSNGGYYLYTSTGGLYGGGSSNKSFTQYDYNVGTIYGFIYDKKKGKIVIYKNGTKLGDAWTGIKNLTLHPVFDFYYSGSTIDFVKPKFK